MKFFPLLSICVLAILATACEQHPLKGDPHPGEKHEAHAPGAKHEAKADQTAPASHSGETKPAEGAKTEEAPKFFPENK